MVHTMMSSKQKSTPLPRQINVLELPMLVLSKTKRRAGVGGGGGGLGREGGKKSPFLRQLKVVILVRVVGKH